MGTEAFLLSKVAGEAKRRIGVVLAREGMRTQDVAVMASLDAMGSVCQRDLVEVLRVDPGDLVGVLDRLEERRLVVRGRDRLDRRRHSLRLTAAGRRKLDACLRLTKATNEELMSPLKRAERSELKRQLTKLYGHLLGPRSISS
jgi:DNA-binding MarR family transcriptional regulator